MAEADWEGEDGGKGGEQDLLEFEFAFRGEFNLVVLDVCDLDGDEDLGLALGPLQLWEGSMHRGQSQSEGRKEVHLQGSHFGDYF